MIAATTTTILLVDDQPLVRTGLRQVFDTEPDLMVVGEGADGIEAIERTLELAPDVLVMDIRMPRCDGIEATRRILAAGSQARVLVLTTFDEDDYAYAALCAGASGFMIKDAPVEQLVNAVRVVATGHALLAPSTTRRLVETMAGRGERVRPAAPRELDRLTEREREILLELAQGRTNLEIAQSLFVTESTVKTHVSRVLAKLGLRDRVHAVIAGYEWGLIVPGQST
jgi:DNA-binding NarL/FixJ family response regulator